MIVSVDVGRAQVRVLEPGVLTQLAVQASGREAEVGALLGSLGRLDGAHVWLLVEELRRRARPPDAGDTWDEQFDAMTRYAAERGWTDAQQRFVRAHLDVRPEQEE